MRFEDKIVLITGAANGIGRCLAELFAKAGADLILWDIDTMGMDHLAYKLQVDYGTDVNYYTVDISDREAVRELHYDVLRTWGDCPPDIVINNAGIGHNGELSEISIEELDKLTAVNLTGPMYISWLFARDMAERGEGQIVNVSSGQAFFKLPTWSAYATTKVALGTFSEALGIEIKKHGVDVTTVYPFMVNTDFYKGVEEGAQTWASKMSMVLLPFYSQSPEAVAKTIFKATVKRKAVEMVHPINWIGYHLDTFPMVGRMIRRLLNAFLAK